MTNVAPQTCRSAGCSRDAEGPLYCKPHFQGASRRGVLTEQDYMDRFWSFVEVADCWVWRGPIGNHGYGMCGQKNLPHKLVHRAVYIMLVGSIEGALDLDHLCRNRTCCNPDHLQPVTRGENVLRGMGASAIAYRTGVCKYGHLLPSPHGTRQRRDCTVCTRANRPAYVPVVRKPRDTRPRWERPAAAEFRNDLSDPRHGTLNGVNNMRCKCVKCRKADSDYRATARARDTSENQVAV